MEVEGKEEVTGDARVELEGGATSGHTCRVCGRSFPLLSSLSQHMRRHTREKPYKCPYCDHRAAQKGSLKTHVRSHKLGLVLQSLGPEGEAGGEAARVEAEAEKGDQEKEEDSDRLDAVAPLTNGIAAKKHKVNGRSKKKASKKKSREAVREEPPQTSGEAPGPSEADGPDSGGEAGAEVENGGEAETEGEAGTEAGAEAEGEAGEEAGGEAGAELEGESGPFPCSSCSLVFPRASLLKTHMKKHRSSQDHGCRICGRRFRQAWFLQSHMRIHRAKTAPRGAEGGQAPATINGAPQDQASLANDECLYELCAGCGNFFHDRKTLRIHERVHKQSHAIQASPSPQPEASETPAAKARFLECLNLRAVGGRPEDGGLGGRIPQLDPVSSYQAWQLATRGRVVEVAEKGPGWVERLADAEVAYGKDRGQYVPAKADRKRKQLDAGPGGKKKKGGAGGEGAGGRGGAPHRGGRALLTGLTPEAFLALQKKRVREGHASTRHASIITDAAHRDKKPYSCEHCDFHTPDASALSSHLLRQHKDLIHLHNPHGVPQDDPSGVKGYMGYLKLRSTLLSQPFWSPFAGSPSQQTRPAIGQPGTPGSSEGRGRGEAAGDASLLNLTVPVEGPVEGPAERSEERPEEGREEGREEGAPKPAVQAEGRLVRHQCPFCVHTTHYPEVLWIHQRVAHKVDGASSLAPKWAPHLNGLNGVKGAKSRGAKPGRRTGPPPFLEGKDCPALPLVRTQRTQPPGDATASGAKKPAPKTPKTPHPNTSSPSPAPQSKPSAQPASSRSTGEKAPPSVRKTLLPQKKSSARPVPPAAAGTGKPRSSGDARPKVTSSAASIVGAGDSPGFSFPSQNPEFSFHPGSSLGYGRHRASPEGSLLPQEGLGFILARNQARTERAPHPPTLDRTHRHSQSQDTSAVPKGHDLWSVMNMFGAHGSGGYLAPGAPPMEVDIMSLLKNYNPHDLAALYQHWGYVDPRFESQAMLQANGHVGNEVHSSTEAPKQVTSRSSMSTPSLRKAT